MRKVRGFTVVEVTVAFAVAALVLLLLGRLMSHTSRWMAKAKSPLAAWETGHRALTYAALTMADATSYTIEDEGAKLTFGAARWTRSLRFDRASGKLILTAANGRTRTLLLARNFQVTELQPGVLNLTVELKSRRGGRRVLTQNALVYAVSQRDHDLPWSQTLAAN